MHHAPDVVGFDAIDACEMVRAAGLVPYGPEFEPPPTSGTIVAQQPEPTEPLEAGGPVILRTQDRRTAADQVPEPPSMARPV